MISPHTLFARATVIMAACGGYPDRAARVNPTPAVRAARAANEVLSLMVLARDYFRFLHQTRGKSAADLGWYYRGYRARNLRIARALLREAAKNLAEAETLFAALPATEMAWPTPDEFSP